MSRKKIFSDKDFKLKEEEVKSFPDFLRWYKQHCGKTDTRSTTMKWVDRIIYTGFFLVLIVAWISGQYITTDVHVIETCNGLASELDDILFLNNSGYDTENMSCWDKETETIMLCNEMVNR